MRDKYNYQEIAKKIKRVMKNGSTKDDDLVEWICNNPKAEEMINRLTSEKELKLSIREMDDYKAKADSKKLFQLIRREKRRRAAVISFSTSVAAALIAVMFFLLKPDDSDKKELAISNINDDVITIPTLITESKKINLISKQAEGARNDIYKIGDNAIAYNITPKVDSLTNRYNRLVIPPQYTYTVKLSDGTEVIINSGSEFSYPTHFSGGAREVTIDGEAYFKVAKSDIPFIVKSYNATVKVYGTQFNVKSSVDGLVEAVLVEGATSITANNGVECHMTPNTLATVDSDSVALTKVNSANYISWMNNTFKYDEAELKVVLCDIERWYGVSFDYSEEISSDKLSFMLSRDYTIYDCLRFIEKFEIVQFINKGGGKYKVVRRE